MKTYKDFEFSSPLSVSEALNRLKKHTVNPGDETFYGEVNGNHFKLSHDAGRAIDPSDDPHVTGYILREDAGCRVFARAQVPEAQEYYAKFGLGCLIFSVLLIAYIFWDDPADFTEPMTWFQLPQMLLAIAPIVLMPVVGWRFIKKFNKEGKYEVIRKFIDYLDGEDKTLVRR